MKNVCYGLNNFEFRFSSFELSNLKSKGTLGRIELFDPKDNNLDKFVEIKYSNKRSIFSRGIFFNPKDGLKNSDFLEISLTNKPLKVLNDKNFYHFYGNGMHITFRRDNNFY